jgi:hypothetical protein
MIEKARILIRAFAFIDIFRVFLAISSEPGDIGNGGSVPEIRRSRQQSDGPLAPKS